MVREALRERFLETLRACGGSAGNARLREALGWQEETYWQVRDALIAEGIVVTGRGRGGSVSLDAGVVPAMPRAPKAAESAATPLAQPAAGVRAPVRKAKASVTTEAAEYRHPTADLALRPEVGTQANFRKRKPPATYRHDSSLSPVLEWDGQNPAREAGEAAIRHILDLDTSTVEQTATIEEAKRTAMAAIARAKDAAQHLARLGKPFLNWAGKAERLSFTVPTLPLFVHERLSTKAIIETLQSHEKQTTQTDMFDLFGDPQRPIRDQVLRAYEYRDNWVNRLILGDSLVVMNSLLHYEGLGGQVQMIYMDPPYGVNFGSNFQPFVRKRDVAHNDDDDMTREPEMVKAYRDTWELGLHSYLTYLRDRFLVARELLHPSGSIVVQIGDDNLDLVRQVLSEVFGREGYAGQIGFYKTSSQSTSAIPSVCDYLLAFAKDSERLKLRRILRRKEPGEAGAKQYTSLFSPDLKEMRPMSEAELSGSKPLPAGWKIGRLGPISSQGFQENRSKPYAFRGVSIPCPQNRHWSYDPSPGKEMDRLAGKGRLWLSGPNLSTILLLDDNPTTPLDNIWLDTGTGSFTEEQVYVVQTPEKAIARCILMMTDPGDLVLDPTCGGGTTACVAEQWGRRWITIDTSRVPIALARQRLLTATFAYYELKDETLGPAGGFVFKRRQNSKGEEVGGIVPHVTLKSIANDEPPTEEVLVDRPEITNTITRVSGPFCVEATIPTPLDWDGETVTEQASDDHANFLDRMLDTLRRSPVLQAGQGTTITLRQIRRPAKSLALAAEALVETGAEKPVALVFGPENGAVSERLVYEAAREAHAKAYAHLYVVGFAIEPKARQYIEDCEAISGIPASYISATPDLMMGDLLKTMRSSEIFSVCGLPEIAVEKLAPEAAGKPLRYQVSLLGLDVFDPSTMETVHRKGDDVPCWMLDTDYNGLVFHGNQVLFPRTAAWDNLKKALRATHQESVWDHLAGTTSAPFGPGGHRQIAVKVIDDRGNELMVVKRLSEGL